MTKDFAIPEGFPEVLRNFTREVLREQPTDIESFGKSDSVLCWEGCFSDLLTYSSPQH